MNDPRVNMHLVPVPSPQKRPASSASISDKVTQPPTKKPRPSNKMPTQVPSELSGLHTETHDNKPLCWNFKLQKS